MNIRQIIAVGFSCAALGVTATPVAEINGTQFSSLSDAFASPLLQQAGVTNTIKLLCDIDGSCITNPAGSCAVLDLNGHTLSGGCLDAQGKIVPILQNNGTLIIDDSSDLQTGAIKGKGAGWSKYLSRPSSQGICNVGFLLLRAGMITECRENDDYGPAASAVDVIDGGIFVMEGGVISNNFATGGADSSSCAVRIVAGASFVMRGGCISGFYEGGYTLEATVRQWGGQVSLLGGSIESGSDSSILLYGGTLFIDGCAISRVCSPYGCSGLTIKSGMIKDLETDTLTQEESYGIYGGVFAGITATISGGRHGTRGAGDSFADGYVVVANTDPVTKDEYPLTVQGAAKIGDTQFASLADAFASPMLQEAGVTNTITLLHSVTNGGFTIPAGSCAVLDLNGNTISGGDPVLTNNGTLIIDDSSDSGNGGVSGNSKNQGVVNYGNLVLNGGMVVDCYDDSWAAAICNHPGSAFTMNDGVITNCYLSEAGAGAICGRANSTVKINGGLIADCGYRTDGQYGAIVIWGGELIVAGGVITNSHAGNSKSPYGGYNRSIEIVSGGSLIVYAGCFCDGIYCSSRCDEVRVCGGVFKGYFDAEASYPPESTEISGGQFDRLFIPLDSDDNLCRVIGGVFGELHVGSVGATLAIGDTAPGGYMVVANTDPVTKDEYPLTVTKKKIDPSHLTVMPYVGQYDGDPHGISVVGPDGTTVKYCTTSNGVYDAELTYTDVCSTHIWYEVSGDGWLTYTNAVPLMISPRLVTMKSADGIWVWDGLEHSTNAVVVTVMDADGPRSARTLPGGMVELLEGETVETTFYEKRSEVGVTSNDFSVAWTGTAKEQNYCVTLVTGKLEVVAVVHYSDWVEQQGLAGADAPWDAMPAAWGGKWKNAFIYKYGEGLADGTQTLLTISFDKDDRPILITTPAVLGHVDFVPSVIGSPAPNEWDAAIELEGVGDVWTLPPDTDANFFRVRLIDDRIR